MYFPATVTAVGEVEVDESGGGGGTRMVVCDLAYADGDVEYGVGLSMLAPAN
jgi:hypothetical protein